MISRHRDRTRRAFRPTVDERLEKRELLNSNFEFPIAPRGGVLEIYRQRALAAKRLQLGTRGIVRGFTTDSGRAVTLTDTDGERYRVTVLNGGTVRAQPLPNGRVGLILQGTGPTSELEINRLTSFLPFRKSAHRFSPLEAFQDKMLRVGTIDVISGEISGIFGFGTTELSGPLIVRGTSTVDRIALASLAPGAQIMTAGTVETLEILQGADLAGAGTGIFIGQDLNNFNVTEGLTIRDGAQVRIGRDLGLLAQPAKGTGLPGQGARIRGNLTIDQEGLFVVTRNLGAPVGIDSGTTIIQLTPGQFEVLGNFAGTENLTVGGTIFADTTIVGEAIPTPPAL